MLRVGVINDGEINVNKVINADEVPLVCMSKRKQIVTENERVQIIKPPITSHNKYRDATLCPFISGSGSLLLTCCIVRGGPTVIKNEIPKYNKKYGKHVLCAANKKAYMLNIFFFLCLLFFYMFAQIRIAQIRTIYTFQE